MDFKDQSPELEARIASAIAKYDDSPRGQLSIMVTVLSNDFHNHMISIIQDESQPVLRSAIRALFAFIEGAVFGLKSLLLVFAEQNSISLSQEEKLALAEYIVKIGSNGDTKLDDLNIPLLNNIQFTFKIAHRLMTIDGGLDFGVSGWEKLRIVKKVRDRLTHPKKSKDLEVDPSEMIAAVEAFLWVFPEIMKIVHVYDSAETKKIFQERFNQKQVKPACAV
jgi:hypothetical protein